MKYFKKVIGKNVYLSPMNADDVEIYSKWLNDCSVTDGLGVTHFSNNKISEKEWLEDSLKKQHHQYAIVSLETDELLGNIGLEDINDTHGTCTVGLFIGEESERGKGYGSEALRLIVNYAFNTLNFNNVMLNVFEFNKRAITAYNKVGFKEMGRRRSAHYSNGKYYDIIYMDIVKDEWGK